ncbi:MAG: pyruvate, phosphate dikinase [Acidobacteriota bacterium]
MSPYVYTFGGGKAEGRAEMKRLLGGKGANLAEMTNLGLPIPPGFTISSEVCLFLMKSGGAYPPGLKEQVRQAIARVEELTGRQFGSGENPLLVSVRSGAAVSMPGMMDTILNLGLNERTLKGLGRAAGDQRFAADCRRRFIQMYGNVVLGIESRLFEAHLELVKESSGLRNDTDLAADHWRRVIDGYLELILKETGKPFPEDVEDQLWGAIDAVFRSWNNKRAEAYRRIHGIASDLGTAVNVQAMVFGNLGDDCATGVAFTRDPATGEKRFYGEWLPNAQGEDVVAGIRTPRPVNRPAGAGSSPTGDSLEEAMPEIHAQLLEIAARLESHYRDMQDLEFTIEHGRLYMLQTRAGKRTGVSAVRVAVEMVEEGLIDKTTALLRVEPGQLTQLLAPVFSSAEKKKAQDQGRVVAHGLAAGPGAASGRVVLSAEKAVDMVRNKGEKVLLVRTETSPEDIEGMEVAEGILTARGGMTSHAAVVARGRGKSCVVGCSALQVDPLTKQIKAGEQIIRQGDWISIDGATGEVILGRLATHPSEILQVLVEKTLCLEESPITRNFAQLMAWTGEFKKLRIRTNADEPGDASVARVFGAEGIGLCRTEHMFFGSQRIRAVRDMILAGDKAGRRQALERILPFQRQDFLAIFKVMEGRPVTIRLLDPPLHEFLPQERSEMEGVARDLGVSLERIREKIAALRELNPMLGHRGCRLGLSHPEIYQVQTEAIFEAACQLKKEGIPVNPEVMIPLVGTEREFSRLKHLVVEVAERVMEAEGVRVEYLIGTMIEVPRACLVADKIAAEADFFSFGTNDLTQMGFGFSRDDVGTFLPAYLENGILPADPFQTLDQEGMGQLVRLAIKGGRSLKPDLKIGVCGEHGGDPESVGFFHDVGLQYVSCSPYRVPVARLAAAQAALKNRQEETSPAALPLPG